MKKLVLLCVSLAMTGVVFADNATTPAAASEPKTLKERLGDKASDEQRVDNCHVPAERRGTKVRPDRCAP
ncbi:hypothetical protein [Caballeronia sp. INDeC2]|uniref:hypothetical protein n=1 Tax=Caballeronia sp. INDeC2 TaxID=2921747 RepID=UPI002027D2D5|nr:hypothetical protein [Caballeronia sp. INDeC2]